MKIQVGGSYLSRDGRQNRIYALDGDPARPIHGATLYGDAWHPTSWTADGYATEIKNEDPRDLISAWYPALTLVVKETNNGT